jgi:hypothetical protein
MPALFLELVDAVAKLDVVPCVVAAAEEVQPLIKAVGEDRVAASTHWATICSSIWYYSRSTIWLLASCTSIWYCSWEAWREYLLMRTGRARPPRGWEKAA